jgi:hypothetical protein
VEDPYGAYGMYGAHSPFGAFGLLVVILVLFVEEGTDLAIQAVVPVVGERQAFRMVGSLEVAAGKTAIGLGVR